MGLVPGTEQSGESDPQQRISKEGDELLRRLMVGCAHYILGPFARDSDLRRHGLKIAARGGKNAKKRARRWRESSRCYCTVCGSPQRYMSHCATRIEREARRRFRRDDQAATRER